MWHSGYPFPKVLLPTQCEFPRGGTSRVPNVTLVPREGNETLRLFATPLHAWERLASSQKLTLLCAGVPLYLPSMPSHVTSWRNTNQDWNGFIHASDALRWGGFPKVSLPTQCLVPFSGNKGYSRNPRRFPPTEMHNTFDKLFKDLGMLRFFMYLKEVSYFHQCCSYLIKKKYSKKDFIVKHLYDLK